MSYRPWSSEITRYLSIFMNDSKYAESPQTGFLCTLTVFLYIRSHDWLFITYVLVTSEIRFAKIVYQLPCYDTLLCFIKHVPSVKGYYRMTLIGRRIAVGTVLRLVHRHTTWVLSLTLTLITISRSIGWVRFSNLNVGILLGYSPALHYLSYEPDSCPQLITFGEILFSFILIKIMCACWKALPLIHAGHWLPYRLGRSFTFLRHREFRNFPMTNSSYNLYNLAVLASRRPARQNLISLPPLNDLQLFWLLLFS